jgi:integrase
MVYVSNHARVRAVLGEDGVGDLRERTECVGETAVGRSRVIGIFGELQHLLARYWPLMTAGSTFRERLGRQARETRASEHRAASFRTIYNYLGYALPALDSWQQRVTSLREITRDDVLAAVRALRGEDAHHLMVALRSVFRALRQERMIFANPCAAISVTRSEALPAGLPPDRLAGLIDRAGSPLARLAVALVSVHAVQPGELRRLTMADLDLPRARITIRSDAGRRILYLDELTLRCLDEWLRERHSRWPGRRTRTCWSVSRPQRTPRWSDPGSLPSASRRRGSPRCGYARTASWMKRGRPLTPCA